MNRLKTLYFSRAFSFELDSLGINIPLVRLTKMQNNCIYVGPKMYNILPTSARNLAMKTFKYKRYNWLAPFYSYDEYFNIDL